MGFLSGVLGAVKNTQTYNVGKNTLNSVSNEIKQYLCSGHEGFKTLFTKLPDRIAEYNREVQRSNNRVRSIVTTMQSNMKNLETEVSAITIVNAVAGKSIQIGQAEWLVKQKLADCWKYVETFTSSLDINTNSIDDRNAINDLNSSLREKIENVRVTIEHENKRLTELSKKEREELTATKDFLNEEVEKLKKRLHTTIDKHMNELVEHLKKLVRDILVLLESLGKKFRDYVEALRQWIEKTERVMNDAEKQIDIVLGHANGTESIYAQLVKSTAEQIEKEAGLLHLEFENLKDKYIDVYEKVHGAEGAAKKLATFHETVKQSVQNKKWSDFQKGANSGWDLQEIDKYKQNLEEAIEGCVKIELPNKIRDALFNLTNPITTQSGKPCSLADIVKQIGTYASGFENRFRIAIENMVGEIVESEGIKKWVALYVKSNVARGQLRANGPHSDAQNLNTAIAIVKDKITSEMKSVVQRVVVSEQDVKSNMEAVQQCLVTLATTDVAAMGPRIIQQIDQEVKQKIRIDPSHTKTYLTWAVSTVLDLLTKATNKAATELGQFTRTSQIEKLSDSISGIHGLAQNLSMQIAPGNGTLGSLGHHIKVNDNSIKNFLRDLIKEAVRKGVDKLQHEIQTNVITGILSKIDNNLESLEKQAQAARAGIESQANIVIRNLNELCGAIKQAAEYSKQNLKKLKDERFKQYTNGAGNANDSIKKIFTELGDLHSELVAKPIHKVKEFLQKGAKQAEDYYARYLKRESDKEVEKFKNLIYLHAQMQYGAAVKSFLQAFHKKATEQLQPLPDEIDRDRYRGYKGFMRYFQEGIVNNLKSYEKVEVLSSNFLSCFSTVTTYVNDEIQREHKENNKKKNPAPSGSETVNTDKLKMLFDSLSDLLNHITERKRYDYKVPQKLDALESATLKLKPDGYDNPNTAVLDSIGSGLLPFIRELKKVYISAYDSEKFTGDLLDARHEISPDRDDWIVNLTSYGKQCSKVFLSALEILNYDLHHLKQECNSTDGACRDTLIYEGVGDEINELGRLLKNCGFTIPSNDGRKQDGELRWSSKMIGEDIFKKLITVVPSAKANSHLNSCISEKPNNNVLVVIQC
ncbi:hypothetical protein, conserved, partial [Babesia bigemina]